ncbi:MAG: S41 family peptidase [Candidatus Buchananbacteria bacterium CG10_big_fil_rev_8_21_14_0_10_42_9]|uniref:S41 family peptidase n=1 Tax=Candidatus Buchananbacteria bacterium CG10_big_fil_rev_8_21_14_0_10_42_9 TaxID=1974526 RepID=A0A2H0W2D7_9BACT|nr:MAG: S41 family peptidase [Candidatus Buchananbacteria bacterium CG10_big_fil_rev_8_21_14_0_10_42_9]
MRKLQPPTVYFTFIALSALALAFIIGFSWGQVSGSPIISVFSSGEIVNHDKVPEYLSDDVDFNLFWKVFDYIKDNALDKEALLDTQLIHGAISGMVAAIGDPYSVYLPPDLSKEFTDELSGEFEGIGAEIGIRNNQLVIIAPVRDTPAERAGLKSGDYILQIDDVDTQDISLDYAVSIIRGKKGTTVVLKIGRQKNGELEINDVPIVRDVIDFDSVEWQLLDNNIALIELHFFNGDTLGDFNQIVREILNLNVNGIVLDLRGNPGGFLHVANAVAGEWVGPGPVVIERHSDGTEIRHEGRNLARFADIPTVVLINGGSASGSEIVAGALQDFEQATIVGMQSFGKGSIQDLKEFDNGSSVKLTVAEWLTPNGRSINEEGILPDIEVDRTIEDLDTDVDPQLDKALEVLNTLFIK